MTTVLSAADYPGDKPHDANAVFTQVIQATTILTDTLGAIASCHSDGAPASAEYARALQATLCTNVLDWIWRWPS